MIKKIKIIFQKIKLNLSTNNRLLKKIKLSKRASVALITLVFLPLIVIAIFFVQRYYSQARDIGCASLNIRTERDSVNGVIFFETGCQVKAMIYCSDTKDGQYDFCGQDDQSVSSHMIKTTPSKLLQPDQGYYIKIDSGEFYESLTYIFPEGGVKGMGFSGQTFYEFNSSIYGECQGDDSYDPKYDFNFDGCVNMSDLAEIF